MAIALSGGTSGPVVASAFSHVARAVEALRPASPPFIIGITGSVAVGKSAFAGALANEFSEQVEIASADGFLLPNKVLDERGLTLRKGFPESFDSDAFARALALAREGRVVVPGYSHVTYDVDPALGRRLDGFGVLIIEGLGLGPHRDAIDALIYLEAAESDLERWFVARFMGLWAAAEQDPSSFYARFRGMDHPAAVQFATSIWNEINLPNLHGHIAAQRGLADIVVRKSANHEIVEILQQHPDRSAR
jgi:type I pantothenate kinase